MPMISVAIFTLLMIPSKTLEQADLLLNQNITAYTSLDAAAEDLLAQMDRAMDYHSAEQTSRLIIHGFRGGNHGNLNLDELDLMFSGAATGGSLELYQDPYLELMRKEQGLRPMEKLSGEAMLNFAAAMDVNYVLSGDVTHLDGLTDGANNNYQLELVLTDVTSGEIIWRGHADVSLTQMTVESSW